MPLHLRSLVLLSVLGVSPAWAVERTQPTFSICSRAGCTVTVKRSGGLDSATASAVAYLTEADAIDWCTTYERPTWAEDGGLRGLEACVKHTLDSDGGRSHKILADCREGILFNSSGERWRLNAGAAGSGAWDEWSPIDRTRGANEVPPISANDDQFAFLCPKTAARLGIKR